MPEASEVCKCIDREDKKLMIKIIDEAISREHIELRQIEIRRMHDALKPHFAESIIGIHSSLVRVRKEFIVNMESLKKKLEVYPNCTTVVKSKEIGYNVKITQEEMPIPYAQRKLK